MSLRVALIASLGHRDPNLWSSLFEAIDAFELFSLRDGKSARLIQ